MIVQIIVLKEGLNLKFYKEIQIYLFVKNLALLQLKNIVIKMSV